jgi:hypothetical protein
VDAPVRLRLHVADAFPSTTFSRAVLRLMTQSSAIESRRIFGRCNGQALEPTVREGELFETAYLEGIPETHACYRDFAVPLGSIRKGWNDVEVRLVDGGGVTLDRLELALYH